MAIPKLSQKDRTAALKKAQEIRSQRMDARKQLKAGELTLVKVLEDVDNEIYAKMRVKYLLESLPQVGKITAAKICNIPSEHIVTDLVIFVTLCFPVFGGEVRKRREFEVHFINEFHCLFH